MQGSKFSDEGMNISACCTLVKPFGIQCGVPIIPCDFKVFEPDPVKMDRIETSFEFISNCRDPADGDGKTILIHKRNERRILP